MRRLRASSTVAMIGKGPGSTGRAAMCSRRKKIMLANVREEYAFQVIDPAAVPDADDFVNPNRPLLIVLGLIGGGLLGVAVALVRGQVRPDEPSPAGEASAAD